MKFTAGPEFGALVRAAARATGAGGKVKSWGPPPRFRLIAFRERGRIRLEAPNPTGGVAFAGTVPAAYVQEGSVVLDAGRLIDCVPDSAKARKEAEYQFELTEDGKSWKIKIGALETSPAAVLAAEAADELPSMPFLSGPTADFFIPVAEMLKRVETLEPAIDNADEKQQFVRVREDEDLLATGRGAAVRFMAQNGRARLTDGDQNPMARAGVWWGDLAQALKGLKEWPGGKQTAQVMLPAGEEKTPGLILSAGGGRENESALAFVRLADWDAKRIEEVLDRFDGEGQRVFVIEDRETWVEALRAAIKVAAGNYKAVRLSNSRSGRMALSVCYGADGFRVELPCDGMITAPAAEKNESEEPGNTFTDEPRDEPTSPFLDFQGPLLLALLETTFAGIDRIEVTYTLAADGTTDKPCRLFGPGHVGPQAWLMPMGKEKEA